MAGAPWRPLLTGDLQRAALQTLDVLAEALARSSPLVPHDGSLSSGWAGLAVCQAFVAHSSGEPRAAEHARACLDTAIDVLSSEQLGASLYAGFTGIAWATDIVDRLLDPHDEDRNDGIDDVMTDVLGRETTGEEPYELIYGLTGLGVYALARWPRATAADSVEKTVQRLARAARRDDAGVYWWTPPALLPGRQRRYYPNGGVDLGMAHGMAAVIPFLARAHALGVAQETIRPLLDGAVSWLLAHTVPGRSGPTVPYFVADGANLGPARSAWCYGDPGVAAGLLLAARDVDEPVWAEHARSLARRAAERAPDETGVVDAGLCHGSAGLAHLFNRMHQLTSEPVLADAARFWVSRTIELCATAAPDTSFAADGGSGGCSGPGLLEGAAGVVLALLAASTSDEPLWDQMLLVSAGQPVPGSAT